MVTLGPSRINGAWTLHLRFNEAVHVPEMRVPNREQALVWLHDTLAHHLAKKLLKDFQVASGLNSVDHRHEAFWLCKEFLSSNLAFAELCRHAKSNFGKWLADVAVQSFSRCIVTAVQRHARTGDLFSVVRHPITQATPVMRLRVDVTKHGFALGVPPIFINLSEGDYDGDKMKIAPERAPERRAIWEECLSPAKLMHNPLGKRIVKLSGVAPLALNLAQSAGMACPDPFALVHSPCGGPIWKGVLEPTYSVDVLLNALASVGCGRPDLLARRWSQPCFQEMSFQIKKQDGTWMRSSDLIDVSFDGFYHVPLNFGTDMQEAWIAAALMRHRCSLDHSLAKPLQIRLDTASARPSALDGLTFAQMRSLLQTFTPKNFKENRDDRIIVQHLPGLVLHGNFQTYVVPQLNAWQRMALVLLRLALRPKRMQQRRWVHEHRFRASLPPGILGHDAVIAELCYCSWMPAEKDVVKCMLELDRTTPGGLLETLYATTQGVGLVEDLSVALQDRSGILVLAQDHERFEAHSDKAGFAKAAQMLRRFAFQHPSPSYRQLRDGKPLSVPEAKALWQRLDLSELLRIRAVPDIVGSTGVLKVAFESGPMTDADWLNLEAKASRIFRPLTKAAPLVKPKANRRFFYLKDWARMVGSIMTPQRQMEDVEASLERLTSLWEDDAEHCATLCSLDALGHAIGNLLNQPTQNEDQV